MKINMSIKCNGAKSERDYIDAKEVHKELKRKHIENLINTQEEIIIKIIKVR